MVYLVDSLPLSSEMEGGLLRRRKYALLHLRFRRRLLASLALFLALAAVAFVAVIALDYYASSVAAVEGVDYYRWDAGGCHQAQKVVASTHFY